MKGVLSIFAKTKTKRFGMVDGTRGIQNFENISTTEDFAVSPKDIIDGYKNERIGTYYATFHVDERYYYIVRDSGIASFGIPEKSATIIIDGWTGKVGKKLSNY